MRAKVEVGGCCDPHRDELFKHLNAHGVQTVVNYPIALPFVEAHGPFKPEQFPNAYADKKKIVLLPMVCGDHPRPANRGDRSCPQVLINDRR